MPRPPDDTESEFAVETARFREILAKGRSAIQLALFDLLVQRSSDRRSPKEIEIAIALFGNVDTLDAGSNSGVRVYIHRLRKRIDEYYQGKAGPRLVISKGEYRIVLERDDQPALPDTWRSRLYRLSSINPALSFALLLFACATLALAGWSMRSSPQRSTGLAAAGQALLGVGANLSDPLIAVGDSMLLAETEDQRIVQRMILNPAIRNRDDFGRYLKAHPETFYRLYDFDLNFAPIGAIQAAWQVQDELMAESAGPSVPIKPVSSLDAEQLKSHDIIFVGRLSQLGLLDLPVFAQSHLRLAAYNRLVVDASGTVFEGHVYTEEGTRPGADFGYLAVRRGPTGRRIIVMAGLGDQGAAAMADLLDAPQDLAVLKKRLGAARNFEAVFRVQSLPGNSLERRLVASWPLP